NFLLKEEHKQETYELRSNEFSGMDEISNTDKIQNAKLEIINVTAKWEGRDVEASTLENITIRVKPGELVAIIGHVGSGKSSLLLSILGELPLLSGTVKAHGKIAYVSQHPWVFSASVRQNIVFGAKFDKTRYEKIIKICALSRDLSILPKGDATLIGDRGITLSGGQRARVSLARALYMDADVYLLDDPLSAVDTAVGKHIFDKCIVKFLENKLRILVTHQVQLLPVADNIVILTEGTVVSQGTFVELSKSGVDFAELLKIPNEDTQENCPERAQSRNIDDILSLEKDLSDTQGSLHERVRTNSTSSKDSLPDSYEPEPVELPVEEERKIGSIDAKVFTEYFKAGSGIIMFFFLMFLMLLAQILYVLNDWWLAKWSGKVQEKYSDQKEYNQFLLDNNITAISNISAINITFPSVPDVDNYRNLYILGSITLALVGSSLSRALLFFKFAVDASKNLHNQMFARLLRTKIIFFDINPVGRVLNRFSKDVGQMDDLLPWSIFNFLQNGLLTCSTIMVAGIFNPWVFIPLVPLAVFFFIIRRHYVQTSRSIKRLEGTTRSPVFSHLSACLQGTHTIRAMGMELKCSDEFDAHQDLHTEAWFLFLTTSRWIAIRMDWLSVLFITCVVYSAVFASDSMDVEIAGLSITYTMNLMALFQWTVRQSTELENQMVSVERVIQYTRLPEEANLESTTDKKPPPSWPTHGSICAKDVSLQYSSTGPYVLKNLSFDISAAEKIGIVGRTGAGKSSLITALFRMVEAQGTLLIDGINIHNIGLHDLRGAISIIPQDPVLFTGTVRRNLDPFQEYSDEQLWRALDETQLKEAISATSEGLYTEVDEGGSNFSAGQRQLMCLARAVLGNTRMLVIDEATANVDPITDELIQQTIRTKFKDCTVLTIAHRLHTIIDSDKIMVLDAGEIVEMDTPMALLSKEAGVFRAMVEQLGKAELKHLTDFAKAHADMHIPSTNGDKHALSRTFQEKIANGSGLPNEVSSDSQGQPKTENLQHGDGHVNKGFILDVTRL
ncbi:ATP-binding cassette subfamily c member 4, partial [Plakobranchus ocellatus]